MNDHPAKKDSIIYTYIHIFGRGAIGSCGGALQAVIGRNIFTAEHQSYVDRKATQQVAFGFYGSVVPVPLSGGVIHPSRS